MKKPILLRALRRSCVAALLACGAGQRAKAQTVLGSLSVGGGVATDQRGIRSSAATVAPSVLLIPDPHFNVGASGSLTRFQGHDWAASAGLTSGMRAELAGPLALAASASAALTRTSFDASYTSVEATPTLEATLGPVTAYAGARVAHGTSDIKQVGTGTPVPAPRSASSSRSSVGPVFGATLALATDRPDEGGSVGYREEHARVERVGVIDRALSASWGTGAVILSASAGMRDAIDERVQFGSVGATVGIGRALAVQAAVGSYPSSRTLGTVGGQFASLGLVLRGVTRMDDASDAPRLTRPALPNGMTRLAIRAPDARRVELAGEWNDWSPVPAVRGSDGTWYADVRLSAGEHRYAFRVDGGRWEVPEGAPSIDDGFGGRSAVVVVP